MKIIITFIILSFYSTASYAYLDGSLFEPSANGERIIPRHSLEVIVNAMTTFCQGQNPGIINFPYNPDGIVAPSIPYVKFKTRPCPNRNFVQIATEGDVVRATKSLNASIAETNSLAAANKNALEEFKVDFNKQMNVTLNDLEEVIVANPRFQEYINKKIKEGVAQEKAAILKEVRALILRGDQQ